MLKLSSSSTSKSFTKSNRRKSSKEDVDSQSRNLSQSDVKNMRNAKLIKKAKTKKKGEK